MCLPLLYQFMHVPFLSVCLLNSESKGNSVTLFHGRLLTLARFGLLIVSVISLLTGYGPSRSLSLQELEGKYS